MLSSGLLRTPIDLYFMTRGDVLLGIRCKITMEVIPSGGVAGEVRVTSGSTYLDDHLKPAR